jgi:hypothetical protein
MTTCPRCNHPVERPGSVCTQCGYAVPVHADKPAAISPIKVLLVILAVALLGVLVLLAVSYISEAGRFGR